MMGRPKQRCDRRVLIPAARGAVALALLSGVLAGCGSAEPKEQAGQTPTVRPTKSATPAPSRAATTTPTKAPSGSDAPSASAERNWDADFTRILTAVGVRVVGPPEPDNYQSSTLVGAYRGRYVLGVLFQDPVYGPGGTVEGTMKLDGVPVAVVTAADGRQMMVFRCQADQIGVRVARSVAPTSEADAEATTGLVRELLRTASCS